MGTFRFANSETYSGMFRQNLPNGSGDYYWPSGDYYKGEFVNGKKHGKGTMKLSDGRSYHG